MHEHGHHDHHEHHNPAQDPAAEIRALMHYMVQHNAAHCTELEALAKQMQERGMNEAFDGVMSAVALFRQGNEQLSEVLAQME